MDDDHAFAEVDTQYVCPSCEMNKYRCECRHCEACGEPFESDKTEDDVCFRCSSRTEGA